MKTDHPIYLFLRSGPEAFRVLTGGLQLEGAYRVCSLTLKSLERRLDGLVAPDGHAGPAYVVEFQGLYGEEHPEHEVLGMAVFLRAADSPDHPHWVHAPGPPIRCGDFADSNRLLLTARLGIGPGDDQGPMHGECGI
ncbi:DUF2887 domain-containing protein [Thiorhodovibrio frisius]|uniref:Uncharacterized protein n=1 Tax=Thiorhodovibrio frisius TaxID=631362 RepID=H8YW80_9GAMM|nr:hypothetical protein Thi970DRAFT_00177 [Thiorhodovibrio frisius]WPL20072.1 hypothetical protein Thiofri_00128 [Thiorhodovibrio frisius]